MGCPEIDWVAFLKHELPADESDAAEKHLLDCPACREEEESLRATLLRVRETLAPVEPSAAFRKTLAERIRMESQDLDGLASASTVETDVCVSRPSSRRSSVSGRRLEPALATGRHRSRYLMASIAVHAVLIACVATWWISAASQHKPGGGAGEGGSSASKGEGLDIRQMYPIDSRLAVGYTDLGAEMSGNDVRVDISPKLKSGTLVVTFGRRLPCLFAYPAETEEETTALLSSHRGSVRADVNDGLVTIPEKFAAQFSGDTRIRLFAFNDRLELWSMKMWQQYEAAQNATGTTSLTTTGVALIVTEGKPELLAALRPRTVVEPVTQRHES